MRTARPSGHRPNGLKIEQAEGRPPSWLAALLAVPVLPVRVFPRLRDDWPCPLIAPTSGRANIAAVMQYERLRRNWSPGGHNQNSAEIFSSHVAGQVNGLFYQERYSKPHVSEKKNNPRAASYASR